MSVLSGLQPGRTQRRRAEGVAGVSIIVGCNGGVWVSYMQREDTEDPQPPPKPTREQLQNTARIANSLRALAAPPLCCVPRQRQADVPGARRRSAGDCH